MYFNFKNSRKDILSNRGYMRFITVKRQTRINSRNILHRDLLVNKTGEDKMVGDKIPRSSNRKKKNVIQLAHSKNVIQTTD